MPRLSYSALLLGKLWRLAICGSPARRTEDGWPCRRVARLASLTFALLLLAAILPLAGEDVRTGPAIGSPIPEFSATDQNGRRETFERLRGPHGLALLFVRSADW